MAEIAAAPVFQICGYQNSGKTSFLSGILRELKSRGKSAAVLKHHGHGGNLTIRENLKDSERYLEEGAAASLAEGGGTLQLLAGMEITMEQQLQLLSVFSPDIILIEGYKRKPFPKIVMLRKPEDFSLPEELFGVRGIVYWPDVEHHVKELEFSGEKLSLEDPKLFEKAADLMLKFAEE
ncbi:molybdopterin-guanine dinucleotide biosynthesis protein B [Peribacillus kribbensis]|uniref:molybdopterin-guanine dinucleotide biosynthesis protein B n=1 Tax=Peribacillus kribbensis TaxID=356658 RepID=UPI000418EE82|nr:molybdopterin-guanine dinucleotide biosynthesis protein B [Peribacillus kribbensis]